MSLRKFPSWSLVGNDLSSGNALSPAFSTQPPISQPLRTSLKLGEPVILGIAIGACVLGFILIAVLVIRCRSKKESGSEYTGKMEGKEMGLKKKTLQRQDNSGKIVFFEGSNLAFDLEDLLRASAEVLGKGTFGTTYKAALEDPTTVVVKRVKEVSVGRRDFEQQMEVIGNIRHENVAPLRAYFYSKDDKLMVYDYYSQGSVSSILHGNRQENQTPLDWESRLRIAIGAARGMAHIHTQSGGKLVHGNIKASNIFLNPQGYGCLSDIGLVALMNPMAPQAMRAAGYRAPEVTDSRKASHASDVFSFGVFLLELLTGKSPIHAVGGDEAVHLVRWVNSVVREEWTAEVFDVELLRYPNIEEEMVEMLQIAMACVVRMPEQRPKMEHLVKMVEGVKRGATPLTPPPADIAFSSAQHSEIISSAILRSQLGSSSSVTQ